MYCNDLNNAYAYECERRKDEMRDAAQSNLACEFRGNCKSPSFRWVSELSVLALLLAILKIF